MVLAGLTVHHISVLAENIQIVGTDILVNMLTLHDGYTNIVVMMVMVVVVVASDMKYIYILMLTALRLFIVFFGFLFHNKFDVHVRLATHYHVEEK